jgi:hypothetical protein
MSNTSLWSERLFFFVCFDRLLAADVSVDVLTRMGGLLLWDFSFGDDCASLSPVSVRCAFAAYGRRRAQRAAPLIPSRPPTSSSLCDAGEARFFDELGCGV